MSWIKVRTNLHEDPRVLCLSSKLSCPVLQTVGMLVRLWSYADGHSTDGLLRLIDFDAIDDLVGHQGFCAALQNVGWVEQAEGEGVILPRFEQHNGQTAKTRAQAARAVQRHRAKAAADGNAETVSRGEERREEKKRESARSRSKGGGKWM